MNDERRFFLYVALVFVLSFLLMSGAFALHLYLFSLYGPRDPSAFREMLTSFLLWESVVAVSVAFLLFLLYRRHLVFKRRVRAVMQHILEALEHRLGNHLATQRVNLSLLDGCPKARERLRRSLEALEGDLSQILSVISHVALEGPAPKRPFAEVLSGRLEVYRRLHPQREVSLRLGRSPFTGSMALEAVLDLLLANAFAYSRHRIWIRAGLFQGVPYLAVRNDLAKRRPPGTGLGHKIASALCRDEGLVFRTRESTTAYLALVAGRRRGWLSRFFHVTL